MVNGFRLSRDEWLLAGGIGLVGFIGSTDRWLHFLDTLIPPYGLIVDYVLLWAVLWLLFKYHLAVKRPALSISVQTLGIVLIAFAFFAVVSFESPYVNLVTHGSTEGVSQVYFQSEDGVLWWFWQTIGGVTDVSQLRWLALIVSPVFIALLGGLLARRGRVMV